MRIAALVWCALAGLPRTLLAQVPPAGGAARPNGAVSGVVLDTAGRPVADADIVVLGSARRTRSAADGRFALRNLPASDTEFLFRKPGYEPARFRVSVPAGGDVALRVTLGPAVRELEGVIVMAQVFNEVRGIIVDSAGAPIEDVEVSMLGARFVARTRTDGAFLFVDIPPGRYLLTARKIGYRPQRLSVAMERQLEREITVRLRALAQGLPPVEVTALSGFSPADSLARVEFEERLAAKGHESDLLTGAELAKAGKDRLDFAIREQAVSWVKGGGSYSCVLVNGVEPLEDDATFRRLSKIDFALPPAERYTLMKKLTAEQVDAVEIYASGHERSRTACRRFPLVSQCSCAANPPAIVVLWLKP